MCIQKNVEEYEQQHLQQVRTHPTAYLAQTLPQVAQYVSENGAHAFRSQGHWQGQYICNKVTCQNSLQLTSVNKYSPRAPALHNAS